MPLLLNLLIGFALALAVAVAAYFARALTLAGAAAATLEGTLIFGLGGLPAAVLLLAFFLSSSLLSRLFARRKHPINEKFSKGSQRDAGQVLANGGLAALFMLLHGLYPGAAWPWVGFAASLAAVNADTWATELGVLSRSAPRLITTGKPAEPGASGAISPAGTLAALAGAALIALLGVLLGPGAGQGWLAGFAAISLAGLFGSLVDSALGATVQAIYYCPVCCKETERFPLHTCGSQTVLRRGWRWLDNDWVNLGCSLAGAGLAGLLLAAQPGWFAAYQPVVVSPSGGSGMSFPVFSSAFEEGARIPTRYTCDGQNHSPALSWRDLPSGTRSLALIAEDPDAPGGTFTHWVLYNLPPTLSALPEGLAKTVSLPGIGTQGENSFHKTGYDGPCPPAGPAHRYYFWVFALDTDPTLPAGLSSDDLRKALQGHILGEAQWVGKYSR